MQKRMILPGALFTQAGAAALALGLWLGAEQWQFARSAVATQGTVVGHTEFEGKDGEPNFAPLVEWRDGQGRMRRFRGQIGGPNPAYRLGQSIEMAYLPGNPSDARLTAFWPAWMKPIIAVLIGIAFLAAGLWLLRVFRTERRRIAFLMQNGKPIEARFLYALPVSSRRQGPHDCWRIVCTGADPQTGAKRNFRSGPVTIHPAGLENASFRVLIDPADPRNYLVELPAGLSQTVPA